MDIINFCLYEAVIQLNIQKFLKMKIRNQRDAVISYHKRW